jgi:hypothetical protein
MGVSSGCVPLFGRSANLISVWLCVPSPVSATLLPKQNVAHTLSQFQEFFAKLRRLLPCRGQGFVQPLQFLIPGTENFN